MARSKRPRPHTSRHAHSRLPGAHRPSLERLESRLLLKSNLIIDFTPDTIANEFAINKFASVFTSQTGAPLTAANRFLDYNADGTINTADATLAAQKISERVGVIFKPFLTNPDYDLHLKFTPDVITATPTGQNQLTHGRQAGQAENDYVIYVGDLRPDPAITAMGFSSQPAEDENAETYGYVLAGEIRTYLTAIDSATNKPKYKWNGDEPLAPFDFTATVAVAIAHEFGHLLGLGHVRQAGETVGSTEPARNYNDVMNLLNYSNPKLATFHDNGDYFMELGVYNPNTQDRDFSYEANSNGATLLANSFATNGSGNLLEITPPAGPTYQNLPLSQLKGFSDEEEPAYQAPAQTPPPATSGTRGTTTAADIADNLVDGFDLLRSQALGYLASEFNFSATTLPLVTGQLAQLLGLGSSLASAVGPLGVGTAVTLDNLRSQLETAGFIAQYFMTDAQLAAAPANLPADYLRVSRVYHVSGLQATTSLSTAGLSALADLAGVNLSGSLGVNADLYFTITFGLDSGGFYLLPGEIASAPILATGKVNASLGSLVTFSGTADVNLQATVALATSNADGRIRLSDLVNNFAAMSTLAITGGAALNAEAKVTVFNTTLILSGAWMWNLDRLGGNFTYDTAHSGFDTEALLNSLVQFASQEMENLSKNANVVAILAQDVPIVGRKLSEALRPLVKSGFEFNNDQGFASDYLASRGLEVLSIVSPQDLLDGDFASHDLIRLRYADTISSGSPLTFSGGETFSYPVAGQTLTLDLTGQVTAHPQLDFDLTIGVDPTGGPYLKSGSTIEASLPLTANLAGKLRLGSLIDVTAIATANSSPTITLTFGDYLNSQPKLYLAEFNILDMMANRFVQAASYVGNFDLNLTASVGANSAQLPKYIRPYVGALTWYASAHYNLVTHQGTYTIDESRLPSIAGIEQQLRRDFLDNLEQYNPLPKSLRSFLAKPLDLFGGKNLVQIAGLDDLDIFLNPDHFRDNSADPSSEDGNEYIRLNYDFADTANIVALLSGSPAKLFSLSIKQNFDAPSVSVPVVPESPIATFLGIVSATYNVDLVAHLHTSIAVTAGFDTAGFYVAPTDPGQHLFSLTGSLGGELTINGYLAILRLLEVTGDLSLVANLLVDLLPTAENVVRANQMAQSLSSTFDLGLSLGLKGKIGFVQLGTELTLSTNRYELANFPLYKKSTGAGQEPGEDASVFESVRDGLQELIRKVVDPLGIFPIAEKIFEAGKKAVDHAGEVIEDVREDAEQAYDDVKKKFGAWWNPRKEAVEEWGNDFDEKRRKFQENPVGYVTGGIQDAWDSWTGSGDDDPPEPPPPIFTYNAYVAEDGTLYVLWDDAKATTYLHDPKGDLKIGMRDGSILIEGPAFETHYVLPPFFGSPETEIVRQHPNVNVFNATGITAIRIYGGESDDAIQIVTNVGVPVTMFGQGGNDLLIGNDEDDLLIGNNGNDTLVGAGGWDNLDGGQDDDSLYGGLGNDTLNGGFGNDYLDESSVDDDVAMLDRSLEYNFMMGGDGNDTLIGSGGREQMQGGRGRDKLFGLGGDDTLNSGPPTASNYFPGDENDYLDGGSGNDTLEGGVGDDVLLGGKGTDYLDGGAGDDRLYADQLLDSTETSPNHLLGGAGNDLLQGAYGVDILEGGAGADVLRGGRGNDVLIGAGESVDPQDNGNDLLYGDAGNDVLIGGFSGPGQINFEAADIEGYSLLNGGSGQDTITGGDGPDYIIGGAHNDFLYGGGGNDTLAGTTGSDIFFGEGGNDLILLSLADDGLTGSIAYGGDGLDTVSGSAGIDQVYGGNSTDLIYGGAGNDSLFGDDGNDTIYAGAGSVLIRGNDGDDVIYGDASVDSIDEIYGDDGNDIIHGGAGIATIEGGKGNDTVYGATTGNHISGGDGNDTIYGSTAIDYITGGFGNDQLFGIAGNDELYGDEDNDLIYGGLGAVLIYGGTGNDAIVTGSSSTSLLNTVFGGAGNDTITCLGGTNIVSGGTGQDTITGGPGDDQIHGDDDDDVIHGGAGTQMLAGDDGNDEIHGGSGRATIYGDIGNDLIYGAAIATEIHANEGNDTIYGGAGTDLIYGDEGDDEIHGGVGRATIWAAIGNDTIYGAAIATEIHAEEGDDTVYGGAGRDLIYAAAGEDHVYGGTGTAVIYGGLGNDWLVGAGGNNLIWGDEGDDTIYGGASVSVIDGGTGNDEIHGGDGTATIYAGAGADLIYGAAQFTEIHGGDGDDTVFGGLHRDLIYADDGDDQIHGGTGIMSVFAGSGNDTIWGAQWGGELHGGSGLDIVYGGPSAERIFGDEGDDQLHGGAGDDTILGGAGNDTIAGDDGQDDLQGEAGNDQLAGGTGDDRLDGGAGVNVLAGDEGGDTLDARFGWGDTLLGGLGFDTFQGSQGPDNIDGGAGNDVVYANGGDDIVVGGADDDTIDAGAGNDTVFGSAGRDLLVGGAGNDLLYAYDATLTDDLAVNYLYGDFGTNGNETGSGNDTLYGGGGNDQLFGEAGVNTVLPGAGSNGLVQVGTGAPSSTLAPPSIPVALTVDGPTLPQGTGSQGRWAELGSWASGAGFSGVAGVSTEPSVVADANGQYVAWADQRSGQFVIYVARRTASGWQELAGSAHGAGISGTSESAKRPSIVLDASGAPVVAWTAQQGTTSDIRVARFNASANGGQGAWESVGNSLAVTGVSATGAADFAKLVATSQGVAVAWIDSTAGAANVYLKRFDGTTWQSLAGSAGGSGISGSPVAVADFALAADGANLAVAWSQSIGSDHAIYLREYSGGAWQERAGSATAGGVSGLHADVRAPSLAYSGSTLFASWQSVELDRGQVHASRFSGGTWVTAPLTLPNVQDRSFSQPRLAANGNQLSLVFVSEASDPRETHESAVFATRWNGQAFVGELPLDTLDHGIGGAVAGSIDHLELTVNAQGQPFAVWSASDQAGLRIEARGNTEQLQHVYYVNASASAGGSFTTAGGAAAHTGLSANSPKATIQQVLDQYTIVPGDVILIDSAAPGDAAAVYPGFTLTAAHAGLKIIGSGGNRPTFSGQVSLDHASGVVLQGLEFAGGVAVNTASQITLVANRWRNVGLTIDGGIAIHVVDNEFVSADDAVNVRGGAADVVIEHNTIRGGGSGVSVSGPAGVSIYDNSIWQTTTGISLAAPASGRISGNDIARATVGISVAAPFTGLIEANEVHDSTTGIAFSATAALSANRVHDNSIGIAVSGHLGVSSQGFGGQIAPNQIFDNGTGVQLLGGQVSGQHIYGNGTGVGGTGIVGGVDLAHANLIENNATGVNSIGLIQFNRIASNDVGIVAHSGQAIANNLFDRNRIVGVRVSAVSDVRLLNNTFFAATGDNIQVQGEASRVEVRNNVLWAQSGYDLFVADDSHTGFFSDYNILHSSDAGKLVYWYHDFTDILDWQVDLAEFDLHSKGRTAINPYGAQPRFVDLAGGDLSVFEPLSGQRGASPTVSAGDPLFDFGLSAAYNNLLQNPAFESGLTSWATSSGSTATGSSPTAFSGQQHYASANPQVGFAQQTVDLLAAGYNAAQLDSQTLRAVYGGRIRSAAATPHDLGELSIAFLNGAGEVISESEVQVKNPEDYWLLAGGRELLPAGTRRIQFSFRGVHPDAAVGQVYLDDAFVYLTTQDAAHDAGAYGNTPIDGSHIGPRLALRAPDLYIDWEANRPRDVLWDAFATAPGASVRIDLYQDGPRGSQFLQTIGTAAADGGSFTWIPANSGIAAGTYGLRIHVSLLDNRAVFDRSAEPFTVPEANNQYYVNDASTANDQYSTVVGNNRNTGKLPSAPKPDVATILRSYSLGPNQILYVDTGDYRQLLPLVVSGLTGLGDDQGFSLTGPTPATPGENERRAAFSFIDPDLTRPLVELNNASFVTLANVSLHGAQRGVWLHNNSTQFVGTGLTLAHASMDGLRAETGASVAELSNSLIFSNGGDGINIAGVTGEISGNRIHDNYFAGLVVSAAGPATIEDNDIYGNAAGLYQGAAVSIDNASAGAVTFGNANLSLGRGNRVHDNGFAGIRAQGNVVVVGNSVFGHDAYGAYGIHAAGVGAQANSNVVFDNYQGIEIEGSDYYYYAGATATGNRVYNNTLGIVASYETKLLGNSVYSNQVGLDISRSAGAQIANNLIYDNATLGVRLASYSNNTQLINNTIYQTSGDAVRIQDQSQNTTLRNNILWVQAGYAINVAADSQTGFASDYNDLYVSLGGKVALWQGIARPTLAAWRNTILSDQNSLSQNPLFVDAAGADSIVGYHDATHDGRDDNFHLSSPHGYVSGSRAPVLDELSLKPVLLPSTLVTDALAPNSPAIDRGDPTSLSAGEPAPNGGFVNLGADGGTSWASLSPPEYVLVTRPDGSEVWPQQQSFVISWRSEDFSGAVEIELLVDGNPVPVASIVSGAANTGQYTWLVPDTVPAGSDYRVRVSRGALSDVSNETFTISDPVHIYYVNDASFEPGDWTTSPGDNSNSGLSPAAPKRSIAAVLAAYSLLPGDIIKVDAGLYTLDATVLLGAEASGITLEGYHDTLRPEVHAILDRANVNSATAAIEVAGAVGVTIEYLSITGGEYGIQVRDYAHSAELTVRHNTIYGNRSYGVLLGSDNDQAIIADNTVFGNAGFNSSAGVYVRAAGALVSGNTVHDNGIGIYSSNSAIVTGNTVYGQNDNSLQVGIWIDGGGGQAIDNTVYDNYSGIQLNHWYGDDSISIASGNRAYANTVGIVAYRDSQVLENLVYSNQVGVNTIQSYSVATRVANNLIYNNTSQGILLSAYSSRSQLVGNTIYQPTGVAVSAQEYSQYAMLRNNIIWAQSGPALSVAADSQLGFDSDYNDLLSAPGTLVQWGATVIGTRSVWYHLLGQDKHSISALPQFMDAAGGNFHVTLGSPTIDAGDPNSDFALEPAPNGGRVNLGFDGNTADAGLSPTQLVQVLSPNGLEKLVVGQVANIVWQTSGLPGSTVDLELSADGGQSWSLLAASVALDGAGHGSYDWTIPANQTTGNNYRLRVQANGGSQPSDISDASFLIVNAGHDYYVNDQSLLGDQFTTALGDDSNSGKSPSAPMANLQALLRAYTFHVGDTIHVDAGSYTLLSNIVLDAGLSGIRIVGPSTNAAVFDRANTSSGTAAIEVAGATGVTIEHLSLTGGERGISVRDYSASTATTIKDNTIYGNSYAGISVGTGNDQVVITGNTVYGHTGYYFAAGIDVRAVGTLVTGNTVHHNSIGIYTAGGSSVVGNSVSASTRIGIWVEGTGAQAIDNTVFNNEVGIQASEWNAFYSGGTAIGNRVYGNTTGVALYGNTQALRNTIYANTVGVDLTGTSGALVSNNLVYGNTEAGIKLAYSNNQAQLQGNTVYQLTGDAVRNDGSENTKLRNNILWAASGYTIRIAVGGQAGFQSDYNDLLASAAGKLVLWGSTEINSRQAWYYLLGQDQHSISADPQFIDATGGNFHVALGSPTIDAGDPSSDFVSEPQPNGGRLNLGFDGNTVDAAHSPAQLVQLLSPNGLEKLVVGQLVNITWQTSGLLSSTSDLELSADGGQSWSLLASDLALDAAGHGNYDWTIPADQTTGNNFRLRVRASGGSQQSDISDTAFLIANAGHDYYVNDQSLLGDQFTTALGNDSNSGKTPSEPMANLQALLRAYAFHSGDTIHVDAGNYTLLSNIVLDASLNGVRITGPSTNSAVLNRANTTSGSAAIEVSGATDVTIEHLSLTGGETGILVRDYSHSTGLTVENNTIYANRLYGVYVGPENNQAVIAGNTVYGHTEYYYSTGIHVQSAGALISGNTVYQNERGMTVAGAASQVINNTVNNNHSFGIQIPDGVDALVAGNTVYGQTGDGSVGIQQFGGRAVNNLVYGNSLGLQLGHYYPASASGNRVYNNAVGIAAYINSEVLGNLVYSNQIGVQVVQNYYAAPAPRIANNLIYANVDQGILVSGSNPQLIDNTIYQVVGDAVRIQDGSRNVLLRNNILWVEIGNGIFVTPDSETDFHGDFNVFFAVAGPNGHVGNWNGARHTLADWRAASGEGAHSVFGDPRFVDVNGPDNILGYISAGNGYDGGGDDNFRLALGSPAIDRADPWSATVTDIGGRPRVDDPGTPNTGRPDYVAATTSQSVYQPAAVGVAQNWHADDQAWTLSLPFAFPFYDGSYDSVQVSSNGLLQFGGAGASSPDNSTVNLHAGRRIAALWDDLRTDGLDNDIFVDTSTAGQVTIRWAATSKTNNGPVNFAVTLFVDGRIRFDYGAGNGNLSPTVGVANGNGVDFALVDGYNGQPQLANAASIQLTLGSGGTYAPTDLGPSSPLSGGVAQGWHADDEAWTLPLPFAFTFYGTSYTSVEVSSNGFLQFAGSEWAGDYSNSESSLAANARIAPLWDDLRTDQSDSDIYVDDSVAGQITVRWSAQTYSGAHPINVAVTLFSSGRIRFDYGAGNAGLSPTVGISAGDGESYQLLAYDGQTSLTNANAVELTLAALSGPSFSVSNLGTSNFYARIGEAQNWHGSNTYWNLSLPFAFPFYDGSYTSVRVSSEGFLQFAGDDYAGNEANSADELARNRRIAPLWDNLHTYGEGDDIFVDSSIAGQVTIRWDATNELDGSDVNVAVVLFSDGRFRFDYGLGNSGLTPTIGLSMGNRTVYRLAEYSDQANLANAASIEFALLPSYVDAGAFEFQGSSLDTTPPQVTATTPALVNAGAVSNVLTSQIALSFSKPLEPTDAGAAAAYRLIQDTNHNGLFGDNGDITIALLPQYIAATRSVILVAAAGVLPNGTYQLTVLGGSLHDTSGLALDGAGNATPGSNYVRTFQIDTVAPTVAIDPVVPAPGVSQVTITFSEPISQFSWDDLQFTRNGGANLLSAAQTLTSTDQRTWVLGNLAGLTSSPGSYTISLTSVGSGIVDAAGNALQSSATRSFTVAGSSVVGRRIFYNNSKWDGNGNNGSGISTSDDLAIATDKSAYLPGGGASTFANMTSFSKGINGIMIDLDGTHGALSAADFIFKMGNNNAAGTWATAPAPTAISVRPSAGINGSDRVEIVWADNVIQKTWLQVIIKSNGNTGLPQKEGYTTGYGDVFFFGNSIGNIPGTVGGDSANFAVIGSNDQIQARTHLGIAANRANVYDFDRNKVVDANDELIARGNTGTLRFIVVSAPQAPSFDEPPAAAPLVASVAELFDPGTTQGENEHDVTSTSVGVSFASFASSAKNGASSLYATIAPTANRTFQYIDDPSVPQHVGANYASEVVATVHHERELHVDISRRVASNTARRGQTSGVPDEPFELIDDELLDLLATVGRSI